MFLSDLFRSRGGVSVILNVVIIHSFAFRIREGTISETTGLKNVLKYDKMLQNHNFQILCMPDRCSHKLSPAEFLDRI